ncbi:Arabinose operon regulatory protein [Legionella pneumophila]|uniref:AraC family transcriptional regulator n=1 Tax=Legionella pneumophila TaxID=446 RepID=UPI000770800C|nr:helix-turn-helix domain-containing protein [Legionella pneumophila]HAT8827408.1 helix-turn-helix domain-containing protein [Legionella pneumophila subsp. pneumophila]WAI78706.1 helix-turn-helix domain-containing protein [Legionella pneumophila]CZH16780.1 Arabinose operon regulatory protein [Legionella pneumophila]CZI38699.1 Arabinose operon regulatory protein [Legionella pneumophila]HAT4692448.1 helix-turn-helix transcriptional regulator [Legionella pneumophila]
MLLINRIDLRSYHTESCSHTHDFAQLVLPVSGSMELEVGHYSGVVNDDIGVYIAPNEQHCFAGSQKNLFLVIDATTQNSLRGEAFESNILNLTASTKKLIQFTHHYLAHNERDFFTDSLINQLLFHFAASSFSPEPDLVVIRAKQWIDLYFADSVDVSRVAKHCYLSISQLQRRFKQMLGCGIAEYWRMKKLLHAKKLLSQKNCSIEAIAFEVGYENLPAFSRRFSKVFGESPSQWRAKALTAKKMREIDK